MSADQHFLDHAIRLGARGLGRTAPNPSVGCVLVKDNHVIASARTADGGRPHAETQALASAGTAARGATAYVSLEPCSHHGVTAPCAQALIDAGIVRVVIASIDHDTRVAGRGIAMLQTAGIEVVHIANAVAEHDLLGFFRRVHRGLPYVTLKIATSQDNKIADPNNRWITSAASRADVHRLRAQFDAIITGIGTVLADDPELNVRLPGLMHPTCIRIVCDRRLRLPLTSKLVKTANMQPVWVITTAEAVELAASHATELREAGVVLHVTEDRELAPSTVLRLLGAEGLTRVMVEAGGALSAAFLAENCVDTLYWYKAPTVLGNTGTGDNSALDSVLNRISHAPVASTQFGHDRREIYEFTSCLQA